MRRNLLSIGGFLGFLLVGVGLAWPLQVAVAPKAARGLEASAEVLARVAAVAAEALLDEITPGARPLARPPADPGALEILHEVRPGESLSKLALLYGLGLDGLAERNGIREQDWLLAGETVVVPLADAEADAVSETAARRLRATRTAAETASRAPNPVPRHAGRLLERAEIELRGARFAEARILAQLGLAAAPASALRARLELAAGTAALALGDVDAAFEAFARALDANPELALDPLATSPKVMRVFERARGRRSVASNE